MKRWLPIALMAYMFIAIVWWGYLLYNKNKDLYELQLSISNTALESELINNEYSRQSIMILGEGIVLLTTVLIGLWVIHRSAQKELQSINNQNNFLLSISHELKSPVAAIKLALQTMNRVRLNDNQQKSLLDRATLDSDRLEKMIENVLLSANFDNDSFQILEEETSLTKLLENIVQSHQEMSNREVTLSINLPRKEYKTDESIIRIILDNLLDNSLKYSAVGTPVDLRAYEELNDIILEVRDQGIGIRKIEKDQVLKRFYRGNTQEVRKEKGTGLGLYIVTKLVSKLNGTITIKNNIPQGTIVNIILPISV